MDELQISTVLVKDDDRALLRHTILCQLGRTARELGEQLTEKPYHRGWQKKGYPYIRKDDERYILELIDGINACRELLGQVGWRDDG